MFGLHRVLLSDTVRMDAFRRAIAEVVRPGQRVADLGTGTGILAFLACEAGAARAYAVEATDLVHLARAVAAANRLADRVVCLQGEASSLALPEPVDVIVGELLGITGLEEAIVPTFHAAAARDLRPGGVCIPSGLELWAAPWQAPEAVESVEFWNRRPAGYDFSLLHDFERNQWLVAPLPADGRLAEPARLWSLALPEAAGGRRQARARFEVDHDGHLHGIALWFRARLSPQVELTTSPFDRPTHWNQALLPCGAVAVAPGDVVHVEVAADDTPRRALRLAWWGTLERRGRERARFGGDTEHRRMLDVLANRGISPRQRLPRRNPEGALLRSLLACLDGRRSLAQAARDLRRRHPDRFASVHEARAELLAAARAYGQVPARSGTQR